jgi:hypothetical protein
VAEAADGVDGVLVAVGSRELENGELHSIYGLRFMIYDFHGKQLPNHKS